VVLSPTCDPLSVTPSRIAAIWNSVLPSKRELRRARHRLHAKAIAIAALLVFSYYALVVADFGLPARLAAASVLVVALVATGTCVMHDANHGSFSKYRWLNRTLGFTSDLLGASSWMWRFQHNDLHHGNTNVQGFDADMELAPFARFGPTQPWHPWYRWQHLYIWPLYGFLAMKNLLVRDVVALVRGGLGAQPFRQRVRPGVIVRVVLGKLAHLGWAVVVPLMLHPWWSVLAFYVVCSWLVGFLLAVVFQLAHCVDAAEVAGPDAARRGDDFAAHQLLTTVDIASPAPILGHAFRWFVGGLDHQIEHHLAPRLPHTVYAPLARRFRSACEAHGITYRVHPGIWSALKSHARWLRAMGAPRLVAS